MGLLERTLPQVMDRVNAEMPVVVIRTQPIGDQSDLESRLWRAVEVSEVLSQPTQQTLIRSLQRGTLLFVIPIEEIPPA